EVGLQTHGHAITKEIGFRASLFGEFGDIVLRRVGFKEAVAAMSRTREVHRPDDGVLLLRPLNQGVQVGIERAKAGTSEIIDTRGNQKDGPRRSGGRPTLQHVNRSKIRAGADASPAK